MLRPRSRRISSALTAVLAGLLLVSACSSDDPDTGTEPDSSPSTATDPTEALVERCRVDLPDGLEVSAVTLGDGAEVALKAAVLGDPAGADTVLVLLHQTGASGLCGWGPFAELAAAEGLPSVAIDLCDWGESICPEGLAADPATQVDLAAAHAREVLGADRVVLIGASMGGSLTVTAVAAGADVDAWVDVSGPSGWAGVKLLDLAPRLAQRDLPGLVVQARSDGEAEYTAARALARESGVRFLDGGGGHGYDLLVDPDGGPLPAGRSILDFALGGS
jgi:pimeloyl-ACP methyl ester carboxylesterase